MAFWGVVVKHGESYVHDAHGLVQITQAVLGDCNHHGWSILKAKSGGKAPVWLCTLHPASARTCSLQLELEQDDNVAFSVLGLASIHLFRYYCIPSDNGDHHHEHAHGKGRKAAAGRACLKKDHRIRWRLVEIDTALPKLKRESEHVMSLIHPSSTYMDLNIGIALWLAAGGDGWVDGSMCNRQGGHRYNYKSMSRVLLVGSGADEQCAGYGRHRTKYRLGGWVSLDEEMRLDVQRIWKRNMGRDDRCISDHGKEARFPFLDEKVIKTLLEIPLWEIAKLDEPVGKGDKKILREVAKLLGLQEAALQPKRAIQFGSRIARESNRRNFGSNRAANQASAGSVEIYQHTHRHLPHRLKES